MPSGLCAVCACGRCCLFGPQFGCGFVAVLWSNDLLAGPIPVAYVCGVGMSLLLVTFYLSHAPLNPGPSVNAVEDPGANCTIQPERLLITLTVP